PHPAPTLAGSQGTLSLGRRGPKLGSFGPLRPPATFPMLVLADGRPGLGRPRSSVAPLDGRQTMPLSPAQNRHPVTADDETDPAIVEAFVVEPSHPRVPVTRQDELAMGQAPAPRRRAHVIRGAAKGLCDANSGPGLPRRRAIVRHDERPPLRCPALIAPSWHGTSSGPRTAAVPSGSAAASSEPIAPEATDAEAHAHAPRALPRGKAVGVAAVAVAVAEGHGPLI